ncbi:MAG: acetoin utilization protein AcuC [Gammaproteobacteria bacterium]
MSSTLSRRQVLHALAACGLAGALRAVIAKEDDVHLFTDPALARYGFGDGHPLGIDRQGAFLDEAQAQGLVARATVRPGRLATMAELARFHDSRYVDFVATAEARGVALLDGGDTPVFPDLFAASARVVGTALAALDDVMAGRAVRTLQPIGGLHHAARDRAAGFCVFNDLGVVVETLRREYGIRRVAYVDIDAHHGDGVFYAFERDPDLILADIHQDSRTLFPGTGRADETGRDAARGTKLNIEMPPRADDASFRRAWEAVEAHLARFAPAFIIFQCGADSLEGDPLAQLGYTHEAHAHAARRLRDLAERYAEGRLMAFGGGGYDRRNLGLAWSSVLRELLG